MLQSAPNVKNPSMAWAFFWASSSWFWRKPSVPVSLLVAADSKSFKYAHLLMRFGAALGNWFFGAKVRFQHVPVPFELYSDGIDLPVFEEFGAGAAALHLRDQLERNKLMRDEEYRRKFRREFALKRRVSGLWHKDFHGAEIVRCPDPGLVGKTFGQIGDERGAHPLDAFLDVLVEHGEKNVRWRTVVANYRAEQLDAMAEDPNLQMGFSDAGAHLRNMAFYNFHLRFLKRMRDAELAGRPVLTTAQAVRRLTWELAEFFGGLNRMVRRNDAAVPAVAVGGSVVFQCGKFAEGYGREQQTGRYLRAL